MRLGLATERSWVVLKDAYPSRDARLLAKGHGSLVN